MEDNTKKVQTYLKEMNNYDPDLQQMGAKYLSQYVQSGKVNLKQNTQLARNITENFLKQVASTNFVVHSSAIRQLADMVPYIPQSQLVHIFSEIISAIAKVNTPHERRQVFSTSAGTMIHHAPQQLGIVISDLFVQSINELLKVKTSNSEIQMLLLNVITQFARKWPNVAGSQNVKYDRDALILHLIQNIENSSKLLLVRKSDGALSKLSITFKKNNFQLLFNHKTLSLFKYIRKNIENTDQIGLKNLRNAVIALSNICKVHNPEMKLWVAEITQISIQIINFHKDKDIHVELQTQIIQSSITTMNYLLRGFSSQMVQFMSKGVLEDFIEQCLNFDLQGMMTYISEEIDVQDEYQMEEQYYSEQTVCWKVRAATLRYVTTLMHKNKHFKDNKAKQENFLSLLTSKLTEENQNVSKKAFECFNYIIESISVTKDAIDLQEGLQLKRIKSSQGDFALDLVKQISNQIQLLFNHSKTKEQVKTQASKTLLRIIQLLKQRIIENQQLNLKLLNLVSNLLNKVKIESCTNLLKSIKSLLSPQLPMQKIQELSVMLLNYSKSKNFKVISSSFGTLRVIEKTYPDQLKNSAVLKDIIGQITKKLKEHDADKLIKSSVIRCLGPLYKNIFSSLQTETQNNILNVTLQKLQVEIDKSLVLHQIAYIPQNYQLKVSQKQTISKLLKQASESLGSTSFQLNNNAIQCCDKLIHILLKNIPDKMAIDILNKSRPMINDHKIPKYVDILLESHSKVFKDFVQLITRTADVNYVVKMVNKNILNRNQCIETLKNIAKNQNSRNISIILSKLHLSEEQLIKYTGKNDIWGNICIGALGFIGNEASSEYLLEIIHKQTNQQVKLEAAKALGNISSRYQKLIAKILDLANKTQDSYLYIVSLKQMITLSEKQYPIIQEVLQFLFKKSEESDRETYQYIIAESIGKGAVLCQKQLQKMLKSVQTMNTSRLYIFASALRHTIQFYPKQKQFTGAIQLYIQSVANLTKDKDVNVRYASYKSLNSIVLTHKQHLKNILHESFIHNLLDNLEIKQQLIVIIDYGVNKEKKDLGRPLRIQAFNFVKAILQYPKLQSFTESIVQKCIHKLKEQTSNDLILKRVHIIKKICERDFTAFIPHQNQFANAIGIQEGVLKAHQKQAQTDDERNEGYLKNLLKQIIAIRKIADKQSSDVVRGLVNHIKSSERLSKIIQQIESQI